MGNPYPFTPQPTQAGFNAWVFSVMGVPSAWLPSDSEYLFNAYNTSYSTVNLNFQCVPGPIWLQMVYCLGGHLLATWTPDPSPWPGTPPQPYKIIDGVPLGYFQWLRQTSNILGFVTGIVSSSSDEGTSVGLVVPKQAENLTISDLQLTTTFWGRQYLGMAQKYGHNWGMS